MNSQLDTANPEAKRLLAQEMLLLDAQELVCELMEKAGMNRGQLARALGKTNGFVTQLLSGERNMTLRTLADLTCATGHRVELRAVPIEEPKRYAITSTLIQDSGFEAEAFRFAYMPLHARTGEPVQTQPAEASGTFTHHQGRRRRTLPQRAWTAS